MSKALTTRLTILQKAFELIYIQGYQSTSIDDILATTQVTKGAFYYHFKTKDEMGLALINDLMLPSMQAILVQPLINSKDPVNDIYSMMKHILLENKFLTPKYGCPAHNLAQEMSSVNQEFAKALSKLTALWQMALEKSIQNGKAENAIRKNVNPSEVAIMVMSGYWGVRSLGKLTISSECYLTYLKGLKEYLKNLK